MKKILLLAVLALFTIAPSPSPAADDDPYNGYRWVDGTQVPGYISIEFWYTRAPLYTFGGAVFYAPRVMEATADYRGYSLEGYLDGVAMMSPADIGRTVWLKPPGEPWEGPYLVVDCARRADMWPIAIVRREVVEVGFTTALRWGMVRGSGYSWHTNFARLDGVEVYVGETLPDWLTDPDFEWAFEGNGSVAGPIPVYYPVWVLDNAIFATRLTEHRRRPVWKGDGCWRWQDDRLLCAEDFPAEPLQWDDVLMPRPPLEENHD